jgi:ureidoglycolate dehydrogenase (NAD+)
MKKISAAELKAFAVQVFTGCGVSQEDAETTAEVLVTTDTWGVSTHGTKAVRGYAARLRVGGLNPKGRPKIDREGPGWAVVDGDMSLGMITSIFAMKVAMAKAKVNGIAMVTVHNSCHFGAAGYYTWMASQENLIGMAMSNDIPSVAAPGSKGAIFGSDPFAFGAPGGSHPAMNLDMSTAVVAGGKIRLMVAEGKPIPDGWLLTKEGKPTNDGTMYPYQASLLPMGGYKGYGIAMMIEVLAGMLSGSQVRDKIGGWLDEPLSKKTDHGHAFIAIDPKVFVGLDAYNQAMSTMVDSIKKEPVVEGAKPLLIPGEMEHHKRAAALQDTIPLGDDVIEYLQTAAKEASLPLPKCLQ